MTDRVGDVIWRPSREQLRDSAYAAFVRWLTVTGRAAFGEAPAYRDVWQWSVDSVGRFWQAFADYAGVAGAASAPGAPAAMPGRGWFPETGVNYAARCLGGDRQGEAIVAIDDDGSSVIVGRSDSTLNRNGIRMGPADLYRVVEAMPEVREALVVGIEEPDGYYMPLFVQFTQGADPDGAAAAVRQAIRSALSPRYVPDEILAVSAIPHTRTGKKLEVPVKRLLMGQPLDTVVDPGAVDDIAALAEIRDAVRRPKPANQR